MSLTSHNILFSLLVFLALEEIVYQKKNAVEEIVHQHMHCPSAPHARLISTTRTAHQHNKHASSAQHALPISTTRAAHAAPLALPISNTRTEFVSFLLCLVKCLF